MINLDCIFSTEKFKRWKETTSFPDVLPTDAQPPDLHYHM